MVRGGHGQREPGPSRGRGPGSAFPWGGCWGGQWLIRLSQAFLPTTFL